MVKYARVFKFLSLTALAFLYTGCGGSRGIQKETIKTSPTPRPTTTPIPVPVGVPTPTPAPTSPPKSVSLPSTLQIQEGVCSTMELRVTGHTQTVEVRIGLNNQFLHVFLDGDCRVPFTSAQVAASLPSILVYVRGVTPITRTTIAHPGVFIGGNFDSSYATNPSTVTIVKAPQSEWHNRNFADLNGDGKTDILTAFRSGTRLISFDGHLSTGSTYNGVRLATNLPMAYDNFPNDQQMLSGDFDGDGITDLATVWYDPSGTANIDIYSGGTRIARWATQQGGKWSTQRWFAADFNGDGKTDIAKIFMEDGQVDIDVHLSTGTGFQMTRWATKLGAYAPYMQFLLGDFNGDGKLDIAKISKIYSATPTPHYDAYIDVYLSDGTKFTVTQWAGAQGWYADEQKWVAADFNGDGKTDVAKYFNDLNLWTADVHVSTGSAFVMARWATQQGGFDNTQRWILLDANGDGKMDWANVFNYQGNAYIDVHLSTGSGFGIARWANAQGSIDATQRWFAADLDGDGKDDLAKMFGTSDLYIDGHFSRGSVFQSQRMASAQGSLFDRLNMRFFTEGIMGPLFFNLYLENDPNGQIMRGPQ